MGFAKRLLSRQSGSVVQTEVVSAPEASSVQPGRILEQRSSADFRAHSVQLATMMFGRRLHRAPSDWLLAPCAGLVSSTLGQYQPAGFEGTFAVPLAPGWSLGVLAELSPRFLVIEAGALTTGQWAGVLAPGGEHLLEELLALIEQAKAQQIVPVLLDNAPLPEQAPQSLTTASAWARLQSAVPAVVDGASANEDSSRAPSQTLQALFDYWSLT